MLKSQQAELHRSSVGACCGPQWSVPVHDVIRDESFLHGWLTKTYRIL